MFRAMFSPILGCNLTVYTALVQCTDLLPTGDTAEMEMLWTFTVPALAVIVYGGVEV
jgi:hypothetical protein